MDANFANVTPGHEGLLIRADRLEEAGFLDRANHLRRKYGGPCRGLCLGGLAMRGQDGFGFGFEYGPGYGDEDESRHGDGYGYGYGYAAGYGDGSEFGYGACGYGFGYGTESCVGYGSGYGNGSDFRPLLAPKGIGEIPRGGESPSGL